MFEAHLCQPIMTHGAESGHTPRNLGTLSMPAGRQSWYSNGSMPQHSPSQPFYPAQSMHVGDVMRNNATVAGLSLSSFGQCAGTVHRSQPYAVTSAVECGSACRSNDGGAFVGWSGVPEPCPSMAQGQPPALQPQLQLPLEAPQRFNKQHTSLPLLQRPVSAAGNWINGGVGASRCRLWLN